VRQFLLDENLSPKIGRALEREYGYDVLSLVHQHLIGLPDHEVFRLAHQSRRIVITQDRDFAEYFFRVRRQPISVIYLDLPNQMRTVPMVLSVLRRFFDTHAAEIDFEDVLVVLSESAVRIVQGPRRLG